VLRNALIPILLFAAACGGDDAGSETVEIHVLDADGAPLVGALLWAEGAGDRECLQGISTNRLEVRRDKAPFVVVGPGHRPMRIEAPRGDVQLRLDPGIPVRVALPDDVVLPEPPVYVGLELTAKEGLPEGQADHLGTYFRERRDACESGSGRPIVFLPDRRELALLVHAPGKWEVRWSVDRIEARAGGFGRIGTSTPRTVQAITVTEAPEEQRFALAVELGHLNALVEDVRKRK